MPGSLLQRRPVRGAERPVWALVACAGAAALRLHRLGAESLWYDETVSAHLADLPVGAMLAHTARDIHPPGYYLLLHLWTAVAGNSEFSLALLSLAAGVLTVAMLHRVTRALASPATANLAALVGAVSAYSVWYAQEVRMYTIAALLMLGLFALTRPLAEGTGRAWYHGAAWSVLAALSLYTVYYSVFLLAVLSSRWLLAVLREHERKGRALGRWVAAHTVLVVLYLPWLPTAVRQALDPPVPPWRSAVTWVEAVAQGGTALAFGESAPAHWWPGALVLLLASIVPLFGSRDRRARLGPTLAFLGPWALMLVASLIQPLFHPRYLFPFAALFLVSLSLGLAQLARRPVGRWLALLLLTIYLGGNLASLQRLWTLPEYRSDDLRGAVNLLARRWLPGDVVLFPAGYTYTAFAHYWPGKVAWQGRVPAYAGAEANAGPVVLLGGSLESKANLGWGDPQSDFYSATLGETTAGLSRALEVNRRLWVFRLYDTVTDPSGDLREWLEGSLVPLTDEPIPGPSYGRLQSFVPRRTAPCDQPVTWGDRARTCVAVGAATGVAGADKAPVYLSVRGLCLAGGLPVHYTLRLQEPDGSTVAQTDGALVFGEGKTGTDASYVLNALSLPLPDAASGTYRVLLGLYLFQDGAPVPLLPDRGPDAAPTGPDGLLRVGELALP